MFRILRLDGGGIKGDVFGSGVGGEGTNYEGFERIVADRLARSIRDALPNALFIGFTGTPIEQNDANKQAVFGPPWPRSLRHVQTEMILRGELVLEPPTESEVRKSFHDACERATMRELL